MKKIIHTRCRLDGSRALPDLLVDAIRPSRAVESQKRPEREARESFPELKEAYKTMHSAAAYFALKLPGDLGAQEAGINTVLSHVQKQLDAGETTDFSRERTTEKYQHKTAPQRSEPGSECER